MTKQCIISIFKLIFMANYVAPEQASAQKKSCTIPATVKLEESIIAAIVACLNDYDFFIVVNTRQDLLICVPLHLKLSVVYTDTTVIVNLNVINLFFLRKKLQPTLHTKYKPSASLLRCHHRQSICTVLHAEGLLSRSSKAHSRLRCCTSTCSWLHDCVCAWALSRVIDFPLK